MKKHLINTSTCLLLLFISLTLKAEDWRAPNSVYNTIKDIYNPSIEDYYKIQNYLSHGERSTIRHLQADYEPNARNFKLIGNTIDEMPQSGIIPVNCNDHEKENCLLVYASFNKNYPRGLKRLISHVSSSDFKGHILYRLGGWPNAAGGSLVLAHVPYAFKVCFFKEAQRLGYKRAFFLDTSILPIVSLNNIFDIIKEDGYFIMGNDHNVGPYMTFPAIRAFGITQQEANKIPSCSSGIVGIDFTSKIGKEIVDRWYQAAENNVAFFSPRPEQNALSIILHLMGITNLVPIEKLAHGRDAIKPDSLLLIEREFVHKK